MHERKTSTKELGDLGETMVAARLEKEGYTIVSRNYQKRYGEIDIIASNNNELIFVEVKMRKSPYFDSAELITPSKQKKIIAVAKAYIAQHTIQEKACRFDVALVDMHHDKPDITYLKNAFSE